MKWESAFALVNTVTVTTVFTSWVPVDTQLEKKNSDFLDIFVLELLAGDWSLMSIYHFRAKSVTITTAINQFNNNFLTTQEDSSQTLNPLPCIFPPCY